MNKQEKQIFTSDNLKETAIMTIAVGHYRRGRIFLFDSEYDLDQQYIRTGNCYVTLYTVACINDHNDIERCPAANRLCNMRKGIRSKDGLHKHPAAGVPCSI